MEAAYLQMRGLTPAERVRVTVAPHAPYSVSPELFRAIAQASSGRPLSVHLGESPEEIQFLKDGSGPWRSLLDRLGAWTPSWTPPNCGPVDYLHSLGLLGRNLIAVHSAQLTDDELRRLAAADATIVTCPRSNRWTGVGDPPVARFYASGARVAIGTDSLASVEDLNLFNEIAVVRQLAPSVPAGRILRSATLDGAQALGFGQDMGWIGPNARAALIAVRVPAGVADVEEYLVGGTVRPDDISWIR
jgi:cytosine/adenosine deaminase-related metal-dependent hydrolase